MSIQVTISGNTKAELLASAANLISLLGGGDAPALSPTEQSRLRGDATVVPPKDKSADKSAKQIAAEKKAAEKAAKEAAKAAEEDEANESNDDDVLGDADGDEAEELTHEDVKKLLLEVREAYPTKNTIISEIVKEHGKAAKLSDVKPAQFAAVAKKARELLKAAKK